MKRNVGNTDRTIRAIVGLVLLAISFLADNGLSTALAVLGVIMLVTAASRLCMLYTLFGINTCKISDK